MIIRHKTRIKDALISRYDVFSHSINFYWQICSYIKWGRGKKIEDYIKRK